MMVFPTIKTKMAMESMIIMTVMKITMGFLTIKKMETGTVILMLSMTMKFPTMKTLMMMESPMIMMRMMITMESQMTLNLNMLVLTRGRRSMKLEFLRGELYFAHVSKRLLTAVRPILKWNSLNDIPTICFLMSKLMTSRAWIMLKLLKNWNSNADLTFKKYDWPTPNES